MMKTYLKRAFQLSDSGVKGLAKSIWSFFLYYVSFVPPMICVFLFADRLLNGNTGKPVVYLLFMLAATLVMYLVINYNYKTTYDETYQESANLRIDLAEQLSKLPLSYFSKHNLSDLAQTIMADVASIEHPTLLISRSWKPLFSMVWRLLPKPSLRMKSPTAVWRLRPILPTWKRQSSS